MRKDANKLVQARGILGRISVWARLIERLLPLFAFQANFVCLCGARKCLPARLLKRLPTPTKIFHTKSSTGYQSHISKCFPTVCVLPRLMLLGNSALLISKAR